MNDRLQIAREKLMRGDRLNVKFDSRGSIREIRCKGCGAVIAGMVLSDEDPILMEVGGKMVPVNTAQFSYLSNYGEITIEFDDGSAHVTNGCKNCINGLSMLIGDGKKAELDRWYNEDVVVWVKEIEFSGKSQISKRDIDRTPVRMK